VDSLERRQPSRAATPWLSPGAAHPTGTQNYRVTPTVSWLRVLVTHANSRQSPEL
jgi:hypothetical protein